MLFIIATSALIRLLRGLIHEILALLGWLFAAWVTYTLSGVVAGWIPETLSGNLVAHTIPGFVLLFIVTVIVTSLVGALPSAALAGAGLKPTGYGLGMVFGLVRGGVIVLVLMTVTSLTSLPEQPSWHDTITQPHAEQATQAAKPLLPSDVAEYARY